MTKLEGRLLIEFLFPKASPQGKKKKTAMGLEELVKLAHLTNSKPSIKEKKTPL